MSRFLVGIYGAIGSGKSTVMSLLAEWGANVLVADNINAELLRTPEYCDQVAALCPMCMRAGVPNKEALRRWMLQDEVNRQALMAIAHPAIRQIIQTRSAEGLWFVELSVYTPHYLDCDQSWCVTASRETAVRRAVERGGWDKEQVLAAYQKQMQSPAAPPDSIVIHNDGSMEDLQQQVSALYRALVSRLA